MTRDDDTELDPELRRLRTKLRTANDKYRRAMQVEKKLKRRGAELERALQLAEEELRLRRHYESEVVSELLRAEKALAKLRSSRSVRIGRAARKAVQRPAALFGLPVELLRILRDRGESDDSARAVAKVQRHAEEHRERLGAVRAGSRPAEEAPHTDEIALPRSSVLRALRSGSRPRVAMIVDDFTRMSIEPECEAIHLTPGRWREELESGQPHLLFVESAWRGIDNVWENQVGHLPRELVGILEWCRAHGTPTVFWNKEDPVHFSTFLNVASRFDHIFTTDIDSIPAYKYAVGHDRVWLMPFACQPAIHNPVATVERQAAVMFAGAFYRRYPERNQDLESMVDELAPVYDIDIYDRNFGSELEDYRFPDRYAEHIRGTLAPGDVPEAYKRYRFGLNMNSVKQSTTMFARRVFELMGSGTLVLGNYSRGVRALFGDLTIAVDDGGSARELIDRLSELDVRKKRHAALRKVLGEHTYADRFSYLRSRITGDDFETYAPSVAVLVDARGAHDPESLAADLAAQRGVRVAAFLWNGTDLQPFRPGAVEERTGAPESVARLRRRFDYVTVWRPADYHGPQLLRDLTLAHRYTGADAVGIDGGFELVGEEVVERPGARYSVARPGPLRAAVLRTAALDERTGWADVVGGWDSIAHGFAVEPFGYCRGARGADVSDAVEATSGDEGLSMTELYAVAESLGARSEPRSRGADAEEDIVSGFAGFRRSAVRTDADGSNVVIASTLEAGTHDYLFSRLEHETAKLVQDDELKLYVECTPGLNVQIAVIYYDEAEKRIGSSVHFANQNAVSNPPAGARTLRVALRVAGDGTAELRSVEFDHRSETPAFMPLRGDALLLTNVYPSRDDRYRNGFVHSRVQAYARAGVRVDVLTVQAGQTYRTYEHEGVDVAVGSPEVLDMALRSSADNVILVHFLDPSMWKSVRAHHRGRRVVVWLHGAEVQPWWRRSYNYQSDQELDVAKRASDARIAFWREVFEDTAVDVHFVFVSQYFADEVMEDVGVTLPRSRYSIVHNPIDTDLFSFTPKQEDARLKVLSIRPFASAKYANDLSVAAIDLLRGEPEFETMDFHFVGDGPLFDVTLEPVRGLPNVRVERRFLSHDEIARMHRQFGVFLVPTRMDAQGVSRDEAMASGLVPVTSRVAAVPEFVDSESGMLCEPESAESLAAALLRLAREPDLFMRLSRGAAERVRAQADKSLVLQSELRLIGTTGAR
ncbi:glycosyltransferase [Cellulosimicrobium cellulans]|uniref:glycosyltransferase family protein n=1 Tax=Cellulosimicrobium cellulans TaxID=1710 RepID=UPI0018842BC5|nr:glycosyltransferase [Cellulosimicrobium cellulans]MBE9926486.1 glycosyltransferase [Cellulosimicrobium cellulans]